MKACPQCHALYSDDLQFCLQDGSVLIFRNEGETVVRQVSPLVAGKEKKGVNPIFAYLTVGLLALIVGGAVVGWILLSNRRGDNTRQETSSPQGVPPGNTGPKANSSPIVTPSPAPTTPIMTSEAAVDLVRSWESSQDSRNFSAYQGCYDRSFQGVKRTVSGSVSRYNYSLWMKDRQKMLRNAKFMDVRVDKLRVTVEGDIAMLEFDQYFRTTGYADFGPKIMRMHMTGAGAKIIYEELKSATLLTD
jgi:hypothetical protein